MTLINLFVEPKRAVVMTDTLANRINGGPDRPTTKLDWLTHLHAVVATRGRYLIHKDALDGMNLILPLAEGLESVPAELPEHLRTWRVVHTQEIAAQGRDPGDMTSEVYVVGWSRTKRCIRAWRFHADNNFEAELLPEGFHITPDVSGGKLPKKVTPHQMIEAAKIQKAAMDRQHQLPGHERPGPCIGGSLWAAEITFSGFTLKPVHNWS